MELYVKNREEWRKWLEDNHSTVDEVWLIYYKKPSGKPRISYNDAVEEALCFGWIDGKLRRINDDYYIQRFTPRRPGSKWSQLNMARVQKLVKEGAMKPVGMEAFKKVLEKPGLAYENREKVDPVIPDDLMLALNDNTLAYNNFLKFSLSNRRLYIFWLNSARRVETRSNRIKKIVERAEKNIVPGMM